MIPKAKRFHGLNSLNFVYRRGKIARSQTMSLKYILNKKRTNYRAAVVVSKKVAKSAVDRNRIRRRVFEQIRLIDPKISQPLDIVITVYSDKLINMPAPELKNILKDLFKEAQILD